MDLLVTGGPITWVCSEIGHGYLGLAVTTAGAHAGFSLLKHVVPVVSMLYRKRSHFPHETYMNVVFLQFCASLTILCFPPRNSSPISLIFQ